MAEQNGSKKQSFWHTLPGMLTAVAALITAITGLIVGLAQTGWLSRKSSDAEQTEQRHEPAPPAPGTSSSTSPQPLPPAQEMGTLTTSAGTIQFDRISGMAMGNGKLTVSQMGTQVEIPLRSVRRVTFGEKNATTVEYHNGQTEQAVFDCYWNLPATFHAGDKEIYYGDCNAFGVVRQIEFPQSE